MQNKINPETADTLLDDKDRRKNGQFYTPTLFVDKAHRLIEEHKSEFSEDALKVLEAGKELVRKSFKYRDLFNDEEPKYQINNWDAGWYQIKALCKTFCKDDLKEFGEIYKKFGEKIRPMIYELGFLKK